MSAPNTLAQLRSTFRDITGIHDSSQVTDTEIDSRINRFYVYDLPEELRLFNLRQTLTFFTEPDVDVYDFDQNSYMTIEPPIYCSGYKLTFIQSPEVFYSINARNLNPETIGTGDGATVNYTATLTSYPVLKNNVIVSAVDIAGNSMTAKDNGAGALVGDVAGSTINYITGAINVTFTAAVDTDEPVIVQYYPYEASRPTTCMFFQDELTFDPVPDMAYEIKIISYTVPTEMVGDASTPAYNELWQLLLYGAVLKFFGENMDFDSYQKINVLYEKQRMLVSRRTLKQLTNRRINTPIPSYGYAPYGIKFP